MTREIAVLNNPSMTPDSELKPRVIGAWCVRYSVADAPQAQRVAGNRSWCFVDPSWDEETIGRHLLQHGIDPGGEPKAAAGRT